MTRKIPLWTAGVLILIASGIWVQYRVRANRDEAAFREQLRLARSEGLPTNGAEFAATVKPAAPEENAAQFYRELRPLMKAVGNFSDAEIAFLRDPSPQNFVSAQAFIRRGKPVLELVDQASVRPRCWFDRNWSDGVAVLMPEFADLKSGAKLLGLRGSVAAHEGRESDALANAHKIFAVSKHAGEEGTMISALVSLAIYVIGMNRIADWALLHPASPAYRQALATALKSIPQPDIRRENREQLMNVLSLIELTLTNAGRDKLGLRDEDLPTGPNLFAFFLSQPKAKISIVKAERDVWAALELPPNERSKAIADAVGRRNMSLLSFPVAAKLYDQLSGGQDNGDEDLLTARESMVKRYQIAYTAVQRAISKGTVARSIPTSDLKSPTDGKPLTYSFDGIQMVISVDGPDPSKPWRLKIPADPYKR